LAGEPVKVGTSADWLAGWRFRLVGSAAREALSGAEGGRAGRGLQAAAAAAGLLASERTADQLTPACRPLRAQPQPRAPLRTASLAAGTPATADSDRRPEAGPYSYMCAVGLSARRKDKRAAARRPRQPEANAAAAAAAARE